MKTDSTKKENARKETMRTLNDLYVEIIEKDFEANRLSGLEAVDYIAKSTAQYRGDPIYSLYMAKLFPSDVVEYMRYIAGTAHTILSKVIKRYRSDEEYRKLFAFPEETEKLIMIPTLYEQILPMARVDIFLNEDDMSFKFCEFNTDGSSGMNEDRELGNAFMRTVAGRELAKKYELKRFELFTTWVDAVKKLYAGFKNKIENPRVGIVDFTEKGCSVEEFQVFRDTFISEGMDCEICEIRDMEYRDGALYSGEGKRIDIIYRRAVTCDILERMGEVQGFLEAVKSGNVCLIGGFENHVVHDKIAFKILHMEETKRFLSDEENEFVREHVPYTAELSAGEVNIDEVLANREKWIIKPRDSYGAKNVFAGVNFNAEEWREIVTEKTDTDYLLQEFCTPFETTNIDFKLDDPQFRQYRNLTGLYVYNGEFAGMYARTSDEPIIAEQYDENDVLSIEVVQ